MRPVNLIPPEQRRGERAPLRSGATSYLIVAGLALVVAAVTGLVLTNNQIADRESEKGELEARKAAAEQAAERLVPYAEFAALQQARRDTVNTLAQSRFDWQRVLRELALVLPKDVWLTELAGTVNPDVQLDGAPGISTRASVPGPARELVGCGATQYSVARFAATLEDIDGVTRVAVDESKRPDLSSADPAASAAPAQSAGGDCRTRDGIARFEIVAAFDAAAVPEAAAAVAPATGETEPAPAPEGAEDSATEEAADARRKQDEQVGDARNAGEALGAVG